MGGGGQTPGARIRQPGTAGLSPGLANKKNSFHDRTLRYFGLAQWTVCTKIYFETGKWDLTSDARAALLRTYKTARNLLLNDWHLELWCSGHADVRQDTEPNLALSKRRLTRVEDVLHLLLDHLKKWKLWDGEAAGERGAYDSPLLWAEDRRVDVWIKVEARDDRETRLNPWIKTRSEIFRRHSPVYHLWVKYRLDYLIDQYEVHDQESYPVSIKPTDIENALALTLEVADPPDVGYIRQGSKLLDRNDFISDAYCVEYRKAYDEAYRRYRASPEYGSLAPKEEGAP